MQDQIVDAARVPGKDGLYCLGPFARKVSFTAQQNRALNLVWALSKTGHLSNGDTVAVIGGGLAGITAAAAFVSHGCKVDLYETRAETMLRQRTTSHRMIHPTINRWPHDRLSITTELPFLEWFFDTCDVVTNTISDQFDEISRDNPRLVPECTVKRFVKVATGAYKLVVEPASRDPMIYKLALLAIGFGEEPSVPGFPAIDYWRPDDLDFRAVDERATTTFVVSGCGDGGLIDALRLAHKHFKRGKLAFDVAARLEGTGLALGIRTAEDKARSDGKPDVLAAAYEAAARALSTLPEHAGLHARLEASYQSDNPVLLVDHRLKSPYSLYSAPIHKLLVAHAMSTGRIEFRHGIVERLPGLDTVNVGGLEISDRACVVVRHGARASFGALLTMDEQKELGEKQRHLSDYHGLRCWDGEYPVPPGALRRDPSDLAYIKARKGLARRALSTLTEHFNLGVRERSYVVGLDGPPPDWLPSDLFGVPLVIDDIAASAGVA